VLIEVFDLAQIPLYNADVEASGDPEPVAAFKQAIRQADAVLMVTPEYNHGVPGVMKNAVDWVSRPPKSAVLNAKPVAIIGASPGITGTARGQSQLRQAFDSPTPTRCRSRSYWSSELTRNSTQTAN
jgi:chromate reductase